MQVDGRDIVLKALVGSHNYGLNTPESDRDYKAFVVPTFEELYEGKRYKNAIITPTEDVEVHDIRKLVDLFYKANVNYLEILASSELYIPQGNPELEEIYSLRNEIFKMNLPQLYKACDGMHKQKMNLLDKGTEGTQHLVDRFGYDTKQAQHAFRVMKVIVDFHRNKFMNFDKVIDYRNDPSTLRVMTSIKKGEHKKYDFEVFANCYYDTIFSKLHDSYYSYQPNEELKERLEQLIMSLVKRKLT